ncbi:esterase/lipase family protein [Planctomycetota bacterium]
MKNLPLLVLTHVLAASAVVPAMATDRFDKTQGAHCETKRWAHLERLEDSHEQMIQERFIPLVEHHDPEIRAGFGGSGSPRSSQLLLHYASGWDEAKNPVPVMLLHGAGLSSNHCFADKPIEQPYRGLAACLAGSGRAVFAVTFAHPQGDNFLQAEAVADAIARVRHVTGAKQVDLVAHSKGAMAARIYLSDAGASWMTRYRGDVRRYVMLGAPNGGIDVAFAYPNLNYWILENKSPAPLSWTRCLHWGKWKDFEHETIYSGTAFPGQAQMVARWDHRYGRTRAEGQWDIDSTYDGGKGQASTSLGIDRAIADGGNLIERLRRKGVHPDVELAFLAGTNPWIMNLIGERRGPSDGLLLVASAFDTEPLTRRGARVIRKDLRYLNHLQLVYHPRANNWVLEVLEQ